MYLLSWLYSRESNQYYKLDTWCKESYPLSSTMSPKEEDPVWATRVTAQDAARATENSASVLKGTVPMPRPLNVRDGDVKENWRRWRQIWDVYKIISRLKTQPLEFRLATFITCVGDALEIYNTINFTSEEAKRNMDTVLLLVKSQAIHFE